MEKKLVADFRPENDPWAEPKRKPSVRFPYPCAIAATFDVKLICRLGAVIASETASRYIDDKYMRCVKLPSFGVNCSEHGFGSLPVVASSCARALTRGVQKSSRCVAFVEIDGEKCSGEWLKENGSHGVIVGDDIIKNVDFARYKGVIYAKNVLPYVLGRFDSLDRAVEEKVLCAIEAGADCGGFFTEEALEDADEKRIALSAEKIEALLDKIDMDCEGGVFSICAQASYAVCKKVATESIVMLKNSGNVLPLNIFTTRIAVIGESAMSLEAIGAEGDCKAKTCIQSLLSAVGGQTEIMYCAYHDEDPVLETEAIKMAMIADVLIVFDSFGDDEMDGSYTSNNKLAAFFSQKLNKIASKTVVVALGAPRDLSMYADADAIVVAWKGGGMAADAISDVLSEVSPTGRLPYSVVADKNGAVYPAGYGLSYGKVKILSASIKEKSIFVYLVNELYYTVRETVFLYKKTDNHYELIAFKKENVDPLDRKITVFKLNEDFEEGQFFVSMLPFGCEEFSPIEVAVYEGI
ncbi:MAG: glycoside hydrolase family 3 C-terminal domain-containing protein [Clostridia bacterium]|nr:glycoside hydrolase family 3 C-terminal domain-containing protein [Clostridia bacterium]